MMKNAFYFGDNLNILREYIPDESVDLIYLDPPFNSNANYNLLFKSPDRSRWSDAQIATFEDTWRWGEAAEETFEYLEMQPGKVSETIVALRRILGENDMLAYLTMMAARLVELERVLKSTGSLYLHCDPTASHYLKIVLDAVFGAQSFRNEIIWKRTSAHSSAKRWGPIHDVLLFYTKSESFTWNRARQPYSQEYIDAFFTHVDADGRRWRRGDLTGSGKRNGPSGDPWRGIDVRSKGRHWAVPHAELDRMDVAGAIHWPAKEGGVPQKKRYLDELPGMPLQDIVDDIRPLHNISRERLGYPTQKPVELLARILEASSSPGDLVLDPFCGCGTTLHAAEDLGRKWIGIDVAVQAMRVVQDRLRNYFPMVEHEVYGIPQSVEGARYLAENHPFKFEEWATFRIGAMHSGKYRADRGIDGTFFFQTGSAEKSRGIVSVKGGRSLNPGMVRDLVGTLNRERRETRDPTAIAVLVCAHSPSKGMIAEARSAGMIETSIGPFPAVQILTVEEIFAGSSIRVPAIYDSVTAAAAGRAKGKTSSGFVDPRELARQRAMLFTFQGGAESAARQDPMPLPLRAAG